jgi:hypothetical protein
MSSSGSQSSCEAWTTPYTHTPSPSSLEPAAARRRQVEQEMAGVVLLCHGNTQITFNTLAFVVCVGACTQLTCQQGRGAHWLNWQ